jgi:hypothetical protein
VPTTTVATGFIADIEILRRDLSRVLYHDTGDGVEYIFGDRIGELTRTRTGSTWPSPAAGVRQSAT